jgi:hypothetical protein
MAKTKGTIVPLQFVFCYLFVVSPFDFLSLSKKASLSGGFFVGS